MSLTGWVIELRDWDIVIIIGRHEMGYAIAPKVGEPLCCETPCNHKDCAAMRADFIDNANCKICGKPIEHGDKFYYIEQGKTDKVHFICEIERLYPNSK